MSQTHHAPTPVAVLSLPAEPILDAGQVAALGPALESAESGILSALAGKPFDAAIVRNAFNFCNAMLGVPTVGMPTPAGSALPASKPPPRLMGGDGGEVV